MRIIDLLNKIKWDKNLNQEDYFFFYYDRIQNYEIEIKFTDIKKIEDNFMIIEKDLEESHIPLHRIKKIMKKKEVIWQR